MPHHLRRRAVALPVLTALVLLAGCGDDRRGAGSGSGAPAFAASYAMVTDTYTAAAQETARKAQSLPAGDTQAAVAVYDQLAKEVERARSSYAALETPREVASELATVVRLLAEQVELLRRVGPAAEAEDAEALQRTLSELTRSTAALAQARTVLDRELLSCGDACR